MVYFLLKIFNVKKLTLPLFSSKSEVRKYEEDSLWWYFFLYMIKVSPHSTVCGGIYVPMKATTMVANPK